MQQRRRHFLPQILSWQRRARSYTIPDQLWHIEIDALVSDLERSMTSNNLELRLIFIFKLKYFRVYISGKANVMK